MFAFDGAEYDGGDGRHIGAAASRAVQAQVLSFEYLRDFIQSRRTLEDRR
jgi:hypothetical protein